VVEFVEFVIIMKLKTHGYGAIDSSDDAKVP